MVNRIAVKLNMAIYDPFYQWDFENVRNYFKDNFFRVIRISNVFYIKTYQSKEAVTKTLNRKFKDVYFEINDPEKDETLFNELEYSDQEILNRAEIKTASEEQDYLDMILEKISDKKEISLEEKFFLEYYATKPQ